MGALQRGVALRLFLLARSFAVQKRISFPLVTMFMSSGSRGGKSARNSRSVSLMSTTCVRSSLRARHRHVGLHLLSIRSGSSQVKEETLADLNTLPSQQLRRVCHLSVLGAAQMPATFFELLRTVLSIDAIADSELRACAVRAGVVRPPTLFHLFSAECLFRHQIAS